MNKIIDALKLAENTLRDIIRLYKFETGTPVTALAAIRKALADHIANAGKVIEPSDYDREFCGDGQPQGEWVDLTEDEIYEAYDAATKSFRRHQSRICGQQVTPQDDPYWHVACAVIAKFKEKNAFVVRPDHIANAGKVIEQGHSEQAPVAWHEPGSYGNVTTHKDWALANGWEPLYKEKNT